MRSGWLVVLFFFACVWGTAQNSNNPFELVPRLAPEVQTTETTENTAAESPANPFDIAPRAPDQSLTAPAPSSADRNPFDLTSPVAADSSAEMNTTEGGPTTGTPPLTEALADPARQDGIRLAIALIILILCAACLLFFRTLYSRCYRALFNDNLLSQLYRERESGALGSFLIMYIVFFFGGGFFAALAGQYFNYFSTDDLWQSTWYSMVGLIGLMLFKHIVLAILGYVFPLAKETSRYSFTIMIFSIIGGLVLSLGAMLLAYAPEGAEQIIIWCSLGLLVLLYLLRSLRGLFIANRFIFTSQFHFLSYICAVEIGPALCFFKLLTDF